MKKITNLRIKAIAPGSANEPNRTILDLEFSRLEEGFA
jgi:hypothetical protein